jgi:ubiquinone/menaquinone biosynthesis C-methylase UbiE
MSKLGPDQRPGYKKIEIIEGYDKWSDKYDSDANPLITLEQEITLELVGDIQGQKVLDLGCGTGRYCLLFSQRGARVVGVDPSPGMLDQAKRKVTQSNDFELLQGTLEQLHFPDEHFDLVVSALTLSHLPELEPTLREVARALKIGGRLVISDVHPFWPVSGHDYTEFFDESGQEYRMPVYTHLVEEYWDLFKKFGLKLDEIREPKIDDWLIQRFPSLKDYRDIPLGIIFKVCKRPD